MTQRDRQHERLIKIAVAENASTAELIRQTLEEAGVPCLLKNTDPLGVMWGSALTGPFAMQVFVLEGDEARALATLAERPVQAIPPPKLDQPRRRQRRRS